MEAGQYPCRARVILFSFSQTLHQQPLTQLAANQRVKWPFSFTFPVIPPASRFIDCPEWTPDEHWRFPPDPPLPPSFEFADIDLARLAETSITYSLDAQVDRPAALTRILSTKCNLSYYPVRAEPTPTVHQRWVRQTVCFPVFSEPRHSWRGLKQKMQSQFHNSRVPKCAFRISVALPDSGVLYARLPILLKVEYDPDGSSSASIPPISLVGVVVSVKARTTVRNRAGNNRVREDNCNNELTLSMRDSINIPLEPDGSSVDLYDKAAVILALLPITFVSYHVKRSYPSLNVTLELQCGRKRHQVSFNSNRRFVVLSPLYSAAGASPEEYPTYFSPVHRFASSSSADNLPPYEPAEEDPATIEPLPSYES